MFKFLDTGKLKLRYIATGTLNAPTLLFLHGTPGDWSAFARYLNDDQLQKSAYLVAVDRPGWGGSSLAAGGVIPTLERQAEALDPLLNELTKTDPNHRLVLVGHSLGASLAARIAMTFPDRVDGLVLISGALDPDLGKPRWYNRVSAAPVSGWLIAKISPAMGNANLEMMPMHRQLLMMRPLWATLKIPITVIQGGKDKLVCPANADFAEQAIASKWLTLVRVPDQGHFILWNQHDMVRARIEEVMARAAALPERKSTTAVSMR